MTWLIAEDDPGIRNLLLESCRLHQVTPLMFEDGQQVLDYLQAIPPGSGLPELALLDIVMPVVEGRAVCSAIRAHPQLGNIGILMMTAFKMSLAEKHRILTDLGADGVVLKPLPPMKLLVSMAQDVIEQRRTAPRRPG